MKSPRELLDNLKEIWSIPTLTIDLMYSHTSKNDPFYQRVVRGFYESARKRHRKFPLIRTLEYGVAVCRLPDSPGDYYSEVEASARRNYKKAKRLGYEFRRIDYNLFLDDITDIRRSTDVRQGPLPEKFLQEKATPCSDPPTLTNIHDYVYFGILKNGQLFAYVGCLVSGDVFMIQHIYGHAAHQSDGIVPMLFIEIPRYIAEHYPYVKYYMYGTYFGASESMRRFKKKFRFEPHKVTWLLGA
jgi:hypothetical protein